MPSFLIPYLFIFIVVGSISMPVLAGSSANKCLGAVEREVRFERHAEMEVKLVRHDGRPMGQLEYYAKSLLAQFYLPHVLSSERAKVFSINSKGMAIYPAPLKSVLEDYHLSTVPRGGGESKKIMVARSEKVAEKEDIQGQPQPTREIEFFRSGEKDELEAQWLVGQRYERTFYFEATSGPLSGISIRVKEWYNSGEERLAGKAPYERAFIIKTVVDESGLFLKRNEDLVKMKTAIDLNEMTDAVGALARQALGNHVSGVRLASVVDTDRIGIPLYYKEGPSKEPVKIGFLSLDSFVKASSREKLKDKDSLEIFEEVEVELHPQHQHLYGQQRFSSEMIDFLQTLGGAHQLVRSVIHKQDVESIDQIRSHTLLIEDPNLPR